MRLLSRSMRRKYLRSRPIILVFIVLTIIDAIFTANSLPPSTRVSLLSNPRPQTIFIASMFRNSEYILRTSYINSLLQLVADLGPSNVYVSITESGSFDNTKGALKYLEGELQKLGAKHRIITGINHVEQQSMLRDLPSEGNRQGWVYTGRPENKAGKGGWEMRRIPYLAKERNMVLEPLFEGPDGQWEKILWINDVVFTTEDVLTLLQTNQGSYSAACALDFQHSATNYYDTFALRDSSGHKTASPSWPFFHTSTSLSAIRANTAVPVKSCWNGMMVFEASPFYGTKGLRFRGVDDTLSAFHVEGSECCLIHADNPLRDTKGVFVNPSVRVSYNVSIYGVINPTQGEGRWPTKWDMVTGVWANRKARWTGWIVLRTEGAVIRKRLSKWAKQGSKGKQQLEERREPGPECLVNELQVLFYNGWNHV